MARNPQIVVEYIAKTADLKSGMQSAAGETGKFSDKLKGIAKGGAIAAGAAGIAGVTAALKIGIGEWKDSTKVAAQTQAVIKSTGGVANVTAGHVDKLAQSLMKKSGVDDEAIASGEDLLLTFTNVRNEAGKGNKVFDEATKAALDMSTALGTDMKTSAMQLGKALNDPTDGLGKLKRSGVTFTDSQVDMVKKLQASGDMLGAQKIILGEVKKEFGGSAEAAGKTLPGQLNILKETFNNLAGDLVGKLIPVLQNTIAWLRDHWPEISAAFKDFWAAAQPVLANLWDLLKQVAQVVIDNWPLIAPVVQAMWENIKNMAKVVGDALKLITDLLAGNWAKAWQDAKQLVLDVLNLIVTDIRNKVGLVLGAATALGRAILDGLKAGASTVADWVGDRLRDARDAVAGLATSMYNAALSVGKGILSGIIAGAAGVYSAVRDKIVDALDAVSALADNAFNRARAIGTNIYKGVIEGIGSLVGTVRGMVSDVIAAVKGELRGFTIGPVKIKGHTVIPRVHPFAALAAGGIVTQPTMALVGEAGPEAVIPLSGGGGVGGSPAIEVRVFIGDQELRGIVRGEVVDVNTGIARTLLGGMA